MAYTNHSGGCPGSDMYWEEVGKLYGVKTIAYSFYNHTQYSDNQYKLSTEELLEGWNNVLIAEKTLKRGVLRNEHNPYIRNLLSRNWFQVKNSDTVFAIGTFLNKNHTKVNGGTGWAVQMAIDNYKNVYFFDQNLESWFIYSNIEKKFLQMYNIPKLTESFAGIGTRELNLQGKNAITNIMRDTFGN